MAFNIGDRVKVVEDEFAPDYVGVTGVITAIDSEDIALYIDGEPMWPYTVTFDKPFSREWEGETILLTNDDFDDDELEAI